MNRLENELSTLMVFFFLWIQRMGCVFSCTPLTSFILVLFKAPFTHSEKARFLYIYIYIYIYISLFFCFVFFSISGLHYSLTTKTRVFVKSNMQSSWVVVSVFGLLNKAFQHPKLKNRNKSDIFTMSQPLVGRSRSKSRNWKADTFRPFSCVCAYENMLFALSSLHYWLGHLFKLCLWICLFITSAEVPFCLQSSCNPLFL